MSRNEYGLKLGYDMIDFPDVDFVWAPDPPLPYKTTADGIILRYRVNNPTGSRARWPVDVSVIHNFVLT